eukprot:447738_1
MSQRKCAQCSTDNPPFACGGCKITKYCSKDCQRNHWKSTHKKQCKKLKQQSIDESISKKSQVKKEHKQQKDVTKTSTKVKHYDTDVAKPSAVMMCDRNSTDKCPCYVSLVNTMKIYNEYNSQHTIMNQDMFDEFNILDILNNYLHLMQHHNSDDAFEIITESLSTCNIKACYSIRRSYRHRRKFDDNESSQHNISVNCQILDKIHCYYMHA